jgi:hypothetical protein
MEEIEYLFDILHYGPNYSTRLKFDHNPFKRHKNNKNREVTKSTSTLANEIIVSMSKVLLIVCLFSFDIGKTKSNVATNTNNLEGYIVIWKITKKHFHFSKKLKMF